MDLETLNIKLQFGKKQKIQVLTQLSYLVDAGVPAPDALRHMARAYKKKRNTILLHVVDKMAKNAANGQGIVAGMENYFPFEICKILTTSEQRGIVAEGIHNAIDFLQSGNKFFAPLGKMTSGIIYVIALLAAIAVIGTIYLPKIGQYVKEWPTISIAFYNMAWFLYHYCWLLILGLVGLFVWCVWSIRHYSGRVLQFIALPFLNIYKARMGYSILKTLALLSANGVGTPDIIQLLTKQYRNGMVAAKVKTMYDRIRAGEQNMGEVMDTGLFTQLQISELNLISQFVGEENFAKIFAVMADIIAKSVVESLKKFAVIVNTICLFLTGAGILWIYGAYAVLASSIN